MSNIWGWGAVVALAASLGHAEPADAQWRVDIVPVVGEVSQIATGADGGAAIRVGIGWRRLVLGDVGACVVRGTPPAGPARPENALRDATWGFGHGGRGIAAAIYVEPTGRYPHFATGPTTASAMLLADTSGRQYRVSLQAPEVFEGYEPIVADVTGDGVDDVVAVVSSLSAGSAIAVYSLAGGQVVEVARSKPTRQKFRWINPSEVADFDGDGRLEIAVVQTPHRGGPAEIWKVRGNALIRTASLGAAQNHKLFHNGGSKISAALDINGDGVSELIVPTFRRKALRFIDTRTGRDLFQLRLPRDVATSIALQRRPNGQPVLVMGLSDGRLAIVHAGLPSGPAAACGGASPA